MVLTDRRSRGNWYFKLDDRPSVTWMTGEQFSIVLNSEGRRIGDFEEQRDWSGGRGGERFSDDPSKYKDAREACTWIPGYLFPSLQWQFSSGYSDAEMELVGSKSWRGLHGTMQSISRKFTATASSERSTIFLWLRRVGNPGTLTIELRDDAGGVPGSVLKYEEADADDITTDVVSVLHRFYLSTPHALTSSTSYHIVACGADTDNDLNHWEVAVKETGTASHYSASGAADAGTWTGASFSMYYRIAGENTTIRWWYFHYGVNFYKVSSSKLYKWNEVSDIWEEITGHGLSGVVGRPIEVNGLCYFPRGDTTAIRVWNGTNWDDQTISGGQGCASGLAIGYSASNGKAQIWRYNNATVSGGTTTGLVKSVSRADAVTAYNTDLAFGNSIYIGTSSHSITGIDAVNNTLWVRKTNEIGTVENDRYTELNYGVRKTPSTDNGIAFISWNSYVFYNWLFSTQRVFSGTVDDVGQGFRTSFPEGREGVDSAYSSYISWLFVAKDAKDNGYSSVMLYDGLNWHEFVRGYRSGARIRDVYVQSVQDGRNRLWFDCGGDSLFVELPYNKGNPLNDSSMKYMHEAVIESSEIDMGTASKLPKYIKEITATTKNLNGQGIRIEMDYQLDDKVGTTEWTPANGSFLQSPEDVIYMGEGNLRKFSYRLRLQTDNQLIPPIVRGIVPNGFSRAPARRILECSAQIKDTTVNGRPVKAKDILNWLEEAAQSAHMLHVNSSYEQYDDFDCILAPPNIYPIKTSPQNDAVTFTLLVL
jgi:hypothetical protein